MTKMIKCLGCGEVKEHRSNGMCSKCYGKKYYENNKEKIKNYNREYNKSYPQYKNEYNHKNGICKPMDKNKNCSQYFGIVISEQVLSKVFKNVKMMPNNNPGFDFICGKGFKVDVKSSCINKKYNYWQFTIYKNKVPDYFTCLAFDNRTDLNPLHFWLIPGNVVNDKQMLTISESTISKWDEYRQDISKVIKCCNNIRGEIK